MATPTAPPDITPVTYTTRRGIATASFAFAFWGTAVFWWYPFGMGICAIALVLGTISIAFGFKARADRSGEPLAWAGVGLATAGLSLGIAVYRFMQLMFEGTAPWGLEIPSLF